MNRNYLIGLDPEIFIKNEDDTLGSSIGIFNGTKEKPIDIGEGCFVQEDNILVEFNTPPVNTKEEFIEKINYSKSYIETILAGLGKKLHYSSSELITEELLKDEKANVFGCSPSFNFVTLEESDINIDLLPEEIRQMRSSGFHVHIGYDNPTGEFNQRLVLAFEIFVTLPLLKYDNDKYNRRKLYGLIGDSRSKSYGVECRSLGGYFLKDDESLSMIWDRIQSALHFADNSEITNEELREMLNCCLDEQNQVIPENVESILEYLKVEELILN